MTNFVKLTHDRLDVGAVSNLVTSNTTGAMSLFVGTTRDHFNGKKVVRLEYEAYESMAEKKMVELCYDLRKKWKLHHVAIYHRLGVVEPSQASVIIAITSEHRKESLEAVQFAIDSLKASVPIWKKEVYEDGTEWKANSECPWSSKVVQQSQKVDPSFVQITASEDEVEARIDAFIARKRTEIDSANIQEFCHRPVDEEEPEFSCARTDSIVIRRTGGSSHLRTSAVVNLFGPTTSSQPANQAGVKKEGTDIPSSLEERLVQLEDHLFGVNRPVPKDVYARIKALEEKVLFLEGVSPEYFNPQSKMKKELATSSAKRSRENVDEVMTSLTQINSRIQELRSTLASKPDPTKK